MKAFGQDAVGTLDLGVGAFAIQAQDSVVIGFSVVQHQQGKGQSGLLQFSIREFGGGAILRLWMAGLNQPPTASRVSSFFNDEG